MFKIKLLNLPLAPYHIPSLGLTQLMGVVKQELGERVDVEVCYANHDVANYLGLDFYEELRDNGEHLQSGFSEWFFRHLAFPELPQDDEKFFERYYPSSNAENERFKERVLSKRQGLGQALDRVVERYRLAEADVVGFTSMFFENNAAIAMARRVKALDPRIVTIMGGANCESPAGEEIARHVEAVDFVASGSALKSFPRFVRNCFEGDMEANHTIHGIFSSKNTVPDPSGGEGATKAAGISAMGEILDINTEIELDYDSFYEAIDTNFPQWEISTALSFETSRGCWWGERSHCTFCGLNKSTMAYRAMDPDKAYALISSLFRYRDRCSVYMCVDNILQRDYIDKVFPRLDTPPGATIFYQLKANLNERELETMARAGVNTITPGFESLNTSTLKLMAKGVTAFHNLQVMKYCALHDVWPGWNLLIGSPGEPEEVYEKYVRELPNLVHLPPPQALFSIHFNRYSPYFMYPEKWGLELRRIDYYEMAFPFPEGSLDNIAYDFMDMNVEAEYLQAMAKWIDQVRSKVEYWQKRWHGKDELALPRLFLNRRDGETWICDSRSGEVREYRITELERRVLERVEQRCREVRLEGFDAAEVTEALGKLSERGLLFEEDGYVMSLVLPRNNPSMTYRAHVMDPKRQLRRDGGAPAAPTIERASRRRRRVKAA